ncbi:MAG: MerR family transcriptional regulator [Leptolyngbyaceae cyanobacterium]
METLQQFAQEQPQFPLDRFVEVTNMLLPQFLPESVSGSRGQESVNSRLVRHYTTQGLLDRPLKMGREARYTYRHLLQLLVLRRLLAEGYSISSMDKLIGGQPNSAFEQILQGGAQLTVEAANPALSFLTEIRDRAKPIKRAAPAPSSPARAASPPSTAFQEEPSGPPPTWTRLQILTGLELHVREDFVPPATSHERDRLLQLIAQSLTQLNASRRNPP